MIDLFEFENSDPRSLPTVIERWRRECDSRFESWFIENYARLDPFKLRVGISLLMSFDSQSLRDIVRRFLDSDRIDIRTTANAYFAKQRALGLIAEDEDPRS